MNKIPDAEYQVRTTAAQEKMVADEIDAIIAHSHEADFANVRYFSNYWPLFETGGIFIPQAGESTLIIGPESETFAAGRSKIHRIAKILEYRFVPNMTFQVDTFLAAADFGQRWENGIHVTEEGSEMLSKYMTEIIEIELNWLGQMARL